MIIDSFLYFNEKELLELRINLLYDYVDKFIIFDANRTHTGKVMIMLMILGLGKDYREILFHHT